MLRSRLDIANAPPSMTRSYLIAVKNGTRIGTIESVTQIRFAGGNVDGCRGDRPAKTDLGVICSRYGERCTD